MRAAKFWPLIPFSLLLACADRDDAYVVPAEQMNVAPPVAEAGGNVGARARLAPTPGNDARGTLQLSSTASGTQISGEIAGLAAGSVHALHVHENGDCSAPDASSAGDHLNPTNVAHGDPGSATHHAGDLPNIEANAQGVAMVDVTTASLLVATAIGKAFILHAGADDYVTQPAGGAGDRIACGVIEAAASTG